MGLRIISLFVVLFIGTNANATKDGNDHYEHMLELITDLQSTVINLEGVVCKQTTELDHMEEKVEKLEDKQLQMEENLMKCEGMVEEQNSTIEAVQGELQELAANISTIECSCDSSPEIMTTPEPTTLLPTSCQGVFEMGNTEDGVYTITVNNSPLQVYCQDGGWTVIQKRYDGSLNYSRNFTQYAEGFGSVEAEHWMGLNHVHELTSTGNWTLRFDLTAFNRDTAWEEYDEFRIDPGTDFTLWFDQSSYRGTAGDSLDYYNLITHGQHFSTLDMDQDVWSSGNCAERYGGGGGWWYGYCQSSLTTGMPYGAGAAIYWTSWKGSTVLKAVTMKIIRN